MTDTERLDWFARNPDNLLAHRADDGTFVFLARSSYDVPWPVYPYPTLSQPWTDLRAAIDDAMGAAIADPILGSRDE